MSEYEWLKATALELARRFGEPALLILRPPPSCTLGTTASIPYVTLLSQAGAAERAAVEGGDGERIEWEGAR